MTLYYHRLSADPPSSYVIEEGICYLALCEHSYPPQLAFSYLENIHRDFSEQHGQDVHRAQRPYHFIEFGELAYKIFVNALVLEAGQFFSRNLRDS